jgi:MoxR-like ATPase
LLEAMQEHRVTIQGRTYPLDEPFYVFATQNPIELEGTYPLPEAQLDRFMFHIVIDHPPYDEELNVVRTTTALQDPQFERPVSGADLVAFQRLVRKVPVAEPVMRYALDFVRASRPKSSTAPDFVRKWVAFGGSVRAAQYLVLGSKARALTKGRYHVNFEDIRALAHPVLRHRVLTNFHAQSEGITADTIVDRLLDAVPAPRRECPLVQTREWPARGSWTRRSSPGSATSSCWRGRWSTVSSTGCTGRRISVRRWTSPSTGATCRATTSAASTGGCSRAPTAFT